MGSGGVSDGYEGTKRPRMMESNPYFAVSGGGMSEGYNAGLKRPRMMEPNPYLSGAVGGSSFYQPFGGYSGGASGYGGGASSISSFPVVRLRGLPFNCDDLDVYKFFSGLDVVDCLLVNKNGRFSGEAFAVFSSPMQCEHALQRDRQNMGRRYIEVFRCKKQDYYNAIAAEVNYGGSFDNEKRQASPPERPKKASENKEHMEYTEILKLRGLPYSVAKSEIAEFFEEFEVTEDNVHIALRSDGKPTGEAYVEFSSEEVAKKAMCKDKETIGSRYVELFPSTPEEARRAESRFRQ